MPELATYISNISAEEWLSLFAKRQIMTVRSILEETVNIDEYMDLSKGSKLASKWVTRLKGLVWLIRQRVSAARKIPEI